MMIVKIPKEQKAQIIQFIQQYFAEERDEEIGDLATEFLLDFVMKHIGPFIYNQAIHDLQAVVGQRMAALDEDIYAMRIPIRLSCDNKR